MNFQEENDKLMNNMVERLFYHAWRNPTDDIYANFRGLEIILNYWCNLGCQYCYVNRYGEKTPRGHEGLYASEIWSDKEKCLKNLDILLDWIVENGFSPKIELFSGEMFSQEIGFEVVEKCINKLADTEFKGSLVIPTNVTFILSDELTKKVDALIEKSFNKNIPIFLSASFDGKLIERNRPFKHTIEDISYDNRIAKWKYKPNMPDPRDDAYYDKVFQFAKKHEFGFHPMVYSETIHLWKENFLWFQKMFEKYEIPWSQIYLLEVRNPEWSEKQIKEFGKFIEFLVKWSWIKCGSNFKNFSEFMFQGKGFNILNGPLSSIGRGLGCGYQTALYPRLGDLSLVSCHRTSYPPFVLGKFKVEDDKITGIKSQNFEHMVASLSFDATTQPYCEQCTINVLCNHGCLGAQMETTGDPFTPIPSVCKLEHEKISALIRAYKRLGIFQRILGKINPDKTEAFKYMEKLINSE